MSSTPAPSRKINWRNALTVGSAAILIGAEVFGVAIAFGWAIAGLFDLGRIGALVFEIAFTILGIVVMAAFMRSAFRIEPLFDRDSR